MNKHQHLALTHRLSTLEREAKSLAAYVDTNGASCFTAPHLATLTREIAELREAINDAIAVIRQEGIKP